VTITGHDERVPTAAERVAEYCGLRDVQWREWRHSAAQYGQRQQSEYSGRSERRTPTGELTDERACRYAEHRAAGLQRR
jgi:hypothetical protein